MTDANDELVALFKALADPNRLKIVGLLARQPCSVEQLAALVDLRPSTISHHLARLSAAGLVSARADSYYNVYQLEEVAFQKARLLFSREDLSSFAADVDVEAYDRKVISNYIGEDGNLKVIPSQRKKLETILRYLAQSFEPGIKYSEIQFNEILGRFHEDVATLRRELVGAGLMERTGGGEAYWRTAPGRN